MRLTDTKSIKSVRIFRNWNKQMTQTVTAGRYLPEHGEDITRAGSIFASIDSSTKLTERLQDVDVVAAHKVLSQVHNGHHESLLHGHMGNNREENDVNERNTTPLYKTASYILFIL